MWVISLFLSAFSKELISRGWNEEIIPDFIVDICIDC